MIYIDRPGTPGFWSEFKRKHNKLQYKELSDTEEGTELIRKLRGYNIGLQHGLCAYCCRSIDVDTSLNEHIKPQGKAEYADLSMDYDNIVACCRDKKTCSANKKNVYDGQLFISPLGEDCESYFKYSDNGEVFADTSEGEYTIRLLNLNSEKLCRARKATIKACNGYHDPELVKKYYIDPQEDGRIEAFTDVVRYYWKRGLLEKEG